MKKLLFLLVAVIAVVTTSCTTKKVEPITPSVTYTRTVCDSLTITADRDRMEIIKITLIFLEEEHGKVPVVFEETTEVQKVLHKGKQVDGFYVNNVGVPYSKTILEKSEKLLGSNSSFSKRCQRTELEMLICASQLSLFEGEYERVVASCEDITTTIVSPLPIVDEASSSWWDTIWEILGWTLLAFLILLALWLLWNLLKWLLSGPTKTRERYNATDANASYCSNCPEEGCCMITNGDCCKVKMHRQTEITQRWKSSMEVAGAGGKCDVEFTDETGFRGKFVR